jgi:hypothetical protein
LAFLFGGIGDARHLLQTIQAIASDEAKSPSTRHYHFTINDIKPEVFARNLLFFMLLGKLAEALPPSNAKSANLSKSASLALTTLYYIFIGQLMPPEIHDHLQSVIQLTLERLKQTTTLPQWIKIYQKDVQSTRSALQSWKTEVPNTYAPKDYILNIIRAQMQNKMQTG